MVDVWRNRLVEGFPRMQNDGYEDFTITCDGRTFKVHSLVLALHSPVLMKMCRGSFKEALDKAVRLEDDDKGAVAAMLDFCYTGKCHFEPPFKVTIPLFVLADKYDMPHLHTFVRASFELELYLLSQHDISQQVILLTGAVEVAYQEPQATRKLRKLLAGEIIKNQVWLTDVRCFSHVIATDNAPALEAFREDVTEAMERSARDIDCQNVYSRVSSGTRVFERPGENKKPRSDPNSWQGQMDLFNAAKSLGKHSIDNMQVMATALKGLREVHEEEEARFLAYRQTRLQQFRLL